jgi:hypothetical protein
VRRATILLAAAALWLPRAARAEETAPDYVGAEKAFQADFASKEHERRLRAFKRIRGVSDPRVVDLVLEAAGSLAATETEVRTKQTKAQEDLGKILTEIERVRMDFEKRLAAPSTSQVKAYNAKVVSLEKKRDEAYEKTRLLEEELVKTRALVAAGSAAMGDVLNGLGLGREAGLARVEEAWMAPASTVVQRLQYVDAVSVGTGTLFDSRLKALSLSETEDARVRVAALVARFSRNDPELLADAAEILRSGAGPVQAGAIDVLRRLHEPVAIDPLIAFLAREDIGRLREDAHRALRSLTGQSHGPFAQPWRDWWVGAKATFVKPDVPADAAALSRPGEGVTYHGITTFSDKILFVLDTSKSMEEPVDPDGKTARAEEQKIAVAKRELLSAIAMLDPHKTFNVVVFGHVVVPYRTEMLAATPVEKERAKTFVTELAPSGGTNIHDVLETGFRMAGWAADRKNYPAMVDTIYFLTDGKPTAGKIQDPERILQTVAEWNRTARITIHCIGMGDHDPAFLTRLATESGGQYVKR